MKKFLFIVAALAVFSSCKDETSIKGTLSEDMNGDSIFMVEVGRDKIHLDSTVITGNTFTFNSKGLKGLYRLTKGEKSFGTFILDGTSVDVNVDVKDAKNITAVNSKTKVMSAENELLMSFKMKTDSISAIGKKLRQEFEAVAKEAGSDSLQQEIRVKAIANQAAREAFEADFATANPNSIVSAFILCQSHQGLNKEQLEEAIAKLGEQKESTFGKLMSETLAKYTRLEPGNLFIDLKMKTPEGKDMALSDYAGKGKYVLVDFWASWCGPCRSTNPSIVALYSKYKDKGFEIVGVSLDNSGEKWIEAIEADGITWPQMSELKGWTFEGRSDYMVNSIPHLLLLDKEGKIIASRISKDDLTAKLAELLD